MKMPKPTEADKARFTALTAELPEATVKPMFGNLGAFINGSMFAGLFGAAIGVKLSPADLAELSALEGTGPFGPAERPMGGYLTLPEGMPDADAAAWLEKARGFVATLPAKKGN